MAGSAPQLRIPASYMRGGTSKGVFFCLADLPAAVQQPGAARDAFLLRLLGSPDPYGKQIDGMGGATSSSSKAVILSPAKDAAHDVDFLFGQVSIDQPLVDWSGNCGNLSAAVGPFAIRRGLVPAKRLPSGGLAEVRIHQLNIDKTIIARVPMAGGAPEESGAFELDGVAFPSAEVRLDFLDPADAGETPLFPTGKLVDELQAPGLGQVKATLINAGIPTVFMEAASLGCTGAELQADINGDPAKLALLEEVRAMGALKMGLIGSLAEARARQHTPKLAWVAPPAAYTASSGKRVNPGDIDLLARAMSMGLLHHAMMGTAAVALGTAAAIPGTLVNQAAGGGERREVTFGHPSGVLKVGAEAVLEEGAWQVKRVSMSRSARVLMEGEVCVPAEALNPA